MRLFTASHNRWPIFLIVLTASVIGACGSTLSKQDATLTNNRHEYSYAAPSVAAPTPTKHQHRQNVDGDEEGVGTVKIIRGDHYDTDDTPLLDFGRPVGTTSRQTIANIVDHYHAAMATSDGIKGCALLHALLVEGILEDNPLPPGAYKKTCAAILTVLFRQAHKQNPNAGRNLHVLQVQLRRHEAIALLGKHNIVEHSIGLRRERDTWKIDEVNDTGMP